MRPRAYRIDSVMLLMMLLMMIVMMIVVIFHRLTPEIVGIGVDRADVVLIMIAVVVTHALAVMFLFTRVLGLIASFGELRTDTREMIP